MNQNPEISIIVPVYKVELYLRQCLDSIAAQTFSNWECILVDDGSPDGSGAICDEYAARDSRFRVIHQKNGGLSAARNTGIRASRAPYIGFVDSDDWTEPEMFATLHQLITTHDTDVAQISLINEYRSFSRPKHMVHHTVRYDRVQAVRHLFLGDSIPDYMWMKLFRRKVINSPFPEGKVFEDIHTLNSWIKEIHSIVASPAPMYHYRRRRGSIVNSSFSSHRCDYLAACIARVKAFRNVEPEAFTDAEASAYLWKTAIGAAKAIARFEPDDEARRVSVGQISGISRKFPVPPLFGLGLKKYFRARLLSLHPAAFIRLMRLVYSGDLHSHHRLKAYFD
ncbi:MAG: glycosyltransferase [Muribaculaceae bacterium]|nr:glycosyltransferase [Muribaculaceae bacterium]MDE7080450.1 glycosyltransferase [Muribaculaceae bacterium]